MESNQAKNKSNWRRRHRPTVRAGNGLSGRAVLAGGDKRRGGGGGLGVEYAVRNKERQRQTDERSGRKRDLDGLGQTGNGSTLSLARSRKAHVAKFLAVYQTQLIAAAACALLNYRRAARDTARTLLPRPPPHALTPRRPVRTSICPASPPPIQNKLAPGAEMASRKNRDPHHQPVATNIRGLGGCTTNPAARPLPPRRGGDPRENISLSSKARCQELAGQIRSRPICTDHPGVTLVIASLPQDTIAARHQTAPGLVLWRPVRGTYLPCHGVTAA